MWKRRFTRFYIFSLAGFSKDKPFKLQLKIDTDDGKGNLRQIELNYIGVILFHSKVDQENGLHGPLGYGDLGYDEVELLNNCIEHRILFSSGIELIIQFSDLKLKYIDHV